mmetsp:Transcript_22423/g.64396  ORF Transcript_22423/g.64396 Transcript_22423/m.64396 type:complete len:361 (-) Transcript_22423:219-1301(-)
MTMRPLGSRCLRNRSTCSKLTCSFAPTLVFFTFLILSCDAGTLPSISAVSTAAAAAVQAASQMARAEQSNNDAVDAVATEQGTQELGTSDDNVVISTTTLGVDATTESVSGEGDGGVGANDDEMTNGEEDDNATLAGNSTSYTTAAIQGLPPSVVAEGSNQNDGKKKGNKKKKNNDMGGDDDESNKNVDQEQQQITPEEEDEDIILEEDPYPYLVSRDTSLCAYEVAGILTCIQWDSFCTGDCEFNSYQNGSGCHVTQRMPLTSDDAAEPAGCGCDDTTMCTCHHPLHDIEYHIGRECHSHMRVDSGEEVYVFPGVVHVDDEGGESTSNYSGGSGRRKLGTGDESTAAKRRRSSNLRRRV